MLKSFKRHVRKGLAKSLLKHRQPGDVLTPHELEEVLDTIRGRLSISERLIPGDPRSGIALRGSLVSETAGFDLIVAHCEICSSHGVGVLLKRLFEGGERIASVRSGSMYGNHTIGDIQIELNHAGRTRKESILAVGNALRSCPVKRILCVPFFPDDVVTAIAASEIFDAPICLYLMDDQNIVTEGIPDDLMREVIGKARVRLAIGPEMKKAYEEKYGEEFWILPPIAPSEFISDTQQPLMSPAPAQTGVLLGNVWSQAWLDDLRRSIREAGMRVDWFVDPSRCFLSIDEEELAEDGIHIQGFFEGLPLKERLDRYAFAIVPSGSADPDDTHQWQAELSLPSRIPFLMATSNIPVIVLAMKDTPAVNFVRRFEIGEISDYAPGNVRRAVEKICSPESQLKFRANAANFARIFSSEGIADWIWESLESGSACDDRFERLFGYASSSASARTMRRYSA